MSHLHKNILILIIVAAILAPISAVAGWGDALKKSGGELMDQGATAAGASYTPSEAVAGIKQVLSLGTESATSTLSQPGAFSSSPATSFSLPSSLSSLGDTSGLLSALNLGASNAVPETGAAFQDTIKNMDIGTDATSALLGGGESSITSYFEQNSRETLTKLVRPIVEKSLQSAGVSSYLAPLEAAQQAAGFTGQSFDATGYVTDKTLDGMFHYIAEKEKAIRSTGGSGTTDLLMKLF